MPIGHGVSLTIGDAGAGKSTPDVIAEGEGKLRGDSRLLSSTIPSRKASLPLKQ